MNTKRKILYSAATTTATLVAASAVFMSPAFAQDQSDDTQKPQKNERVRLDKIERAIKEGKISKEKAELIKNSLKRKIQDQNVNHVKGVFKAEIKGLATFLGTEPKSIREDIQKGLKIEQIIQKHGKTVQSVKNYLIESFKTKLSKKLTNKSITQEKYNKLVTQYQSRLDRFFN